MSQDFPRIILSDTNVAYKLHFFIDKKIVPATNIVIPGLGKIEFHQIVIHEIEQHIKAWERAAIRNPPIKVSGVPAFFDTVKQPKVNAILEFAKENVSSSPAVDRYSADFVNRRKIYDVERARLQARWRSSGTKGNKVVSTPSNADYELLYSAERLKAKLLTNDEILLAISEEVLEPDHSLKVEDILNAILIADPSKKESVNETIQAMGYVGEAVIVARVFENIP